MRNAAVCVGRCDLIADEWPLPTGGIVAEPDFFHLIGDSMADKFRKVKRMGVIMGREFWGFWIWRADEAGGGGKEEVGTDGRHAGAGAEWVRAIRLTMP